MAFTTRNLQPHPGRFLLSTDAPTQTLAAAATDYNVVDLPQDILDTLAAWGATDSLDTTATLSLGVEDGNYIQADGKTATITVQLYGGRRRSSILLCLSTTSLSNSMERTISLFGR